LHCKVHTSVGPVKLVHDEWGSSLRQRMLGMQLSRLASSVLHAANRRVSHIDRRIQPLDSVDSFSFVKAKRVPRWHNSGVLLGHFRYDGAMRPFSELTDGGKLIEVVRWLCVLPAAMLGSFVVQLIVGAVVQIADNSGLGILGDSKIAYSLRLFLFYVPRESVFVIAGAMTAPRHQMATAIVLTVLGICLSLMTHVVGQHLAGNHVGLVNYTHFFAESAGAVGGAAYIFLQDRRKRPTDVTA
jgi:hypothetical protein